ncbi:MAG TPA: ABC transporter permease, partial [Gemmatimonadaceae bacterium]|nr:ABC transporter permease [Gemmatimonadaceae bacterium]
MSWLHALRARLHLLVSRRAAERRMEEEFRLHLELETERLVREAGLEPEEARRQALVAFGGVERHKEELREGRGLAWLSGLSLDLKLGLRMMAKYPGLTLVAVVGMAVAVAICAASFGVISTVVDATLPLPDGNRIVAIQNMDTRTSNEARRTYLHDLATWRSALTAVQDVSAWRTINRNLITRGGPPESVSIAEMSASGFRVAQVPPLKGRYFNDADERAGAPAVVVIGYTVWQNRFAGQSDIIGQTVQLGATPYTIVGVMPEGFAFPVNNIIWTPLRLDPSDFERGRAPSLDVFGRLAPTATLQDAQIQLNAIGARLTAAYPESHEHVQPRVLPYTRSFLDGPQVAWMLHLAELLVSLLLVVIGTNVAILVYARTATRTGEIAVRSALGASRGRIVAQLFAEALVLSVGSAVVGIVGAKLILHQLRYFLSRMAGATEQLPFWMHFDISLSVLLYVAGLAVLAAVIVGALPALKATRRQLHASLQQLGAGRSGIRLGKTWTVLIVAQVAVAVAILPLALRYAGLWVRIELAEPAFATQHVLTATLVLDRPELQGRGAEVEQRVARRSGPSRATSADSVARERAYATRFATLRMEVVRRL